MTCEMELNHQKVLNLLPNRDPWAHKGDFGRVMLLCGSRGYTGAAALAAMGALRSGAGLVYLFVPESIYAIEAVKLTEAIVLPLPDECGKFGPTCVSEVLERCGNMDAVLIGPGMGQSAGTLTLTLAVLRHYHGPVVLDADGINLISGHMYVLRERTGVTILTPHDGEFCRIAGPVTSDRRASAMALAKDTGAIVLLKGHETLITDGCRCYRNRTGNPGMAVGGSGDVLAGMIVSLLGQGLEPLEAAACAAWVHGAAGDTCAREIGQYGMLPTDMLNVLPRLMK